MRRKTGTRLEHEWNGIGTGLDEDWKRTETGLEQDWNRTGTRLEQDWNKAGTGLDQDCKRTKLGLNKDEQDCSWLHLSAKIMRQQDPTCLIRRRLQYTSWHSHKNFMMCCAYVCNCTSY